MVRADERAVGLGYALDVADRSLLSRRDAVGGLAVVASTAVLGGCGRSDAPAVRPSAGAPGVRTREVTGLFDAMQTVDGAGVKLRRSLGSRALPMLDPFLLLDEIHSARPEDYLAGFPTHPHRGFDTVTYMLSGAMEHRDSLGNHGHLGPGSAQWMTAGHGIVHSEMPKPEGGPLWGFQLWVNLPRPKKLITPRYQDLAPERIVETTIDDARVRLVAGEVRGQRGPVEGIVTAPHMLDVEVQPRGGLSHPLPPTHNAFAYVLAGTVELGGARTKVREGQIAVLGPGDVASARSEEGARMLLLAADPIGEPVARSGPFVMNTEDELKQAWDDYRAGRLTVI